MVMVDRVTETSGPSTVTNFTIRSDNVFVENGLFREPGLIENMAQTAACGAGAKPGATEARIGFIGGIRNLKIVDLPHAGKTLTTRVTVLHEVFDATIAQGEVFCDEILVASCELKIFLIPEQP